MTGNCDCQYVRVSILIFSGDETPTIDTMDEFHRFDLPESGTAMTDAAGEEGLARLAPMIKKTNFIFEYIYALRRIG